MSAQGFYGFYQEATLLIQSRFATLGSTTVPSGNRTTKNIWRNVSFDRIGERNEPKRDRRRAEFLSLQCTDLDAVKGPHKLCRDFSHLLFGDCLGTSCSSVSKMYSSVPPSLAGPRNRNSSTARTGVVSMTKTARNERRTFHCNSNPSARSIALFNTRTAFEIVLLSTLNNSAISA
jgi:hypothetical protein